MIFFFTLQLYIGSNRQTHRNKQKNIIRMKQYLLALALLLSLNVGEVSASQKLSHRRHQPVATQAHHRATTATTDSVYRVHANQQGIDAYSDTSSTVDATDSMAQSVTVYHNGKKMTSDCDSIIQAILNGTLGAGGTLLFLVAILAAFVFLLAPFIAFIFLMKFLINRHNKRIELASKAMEKGMPIPESAKPLKSESAADYWKRGVQNLSLGIGMAIMFAFMRNSGFLVGCGLMFACYGIGQMVISKTMK